MRLRSADDIGRLIRSRRKELELTQADLAELVGTTRAWVISAEQGKKRLELDLVLRTFEALDLVLDATPRRRARSAPQSVEDEPDTEVIFEIKHDPERRLVPLELDRFLEVFEEPYISGTPTRPTISVRYQFVDPRERTEGTRPDDGAHQDYMTRLAEFVNRLGRVYEEGSDFAYRPPGLHLRPTVPGPDSTDAVNPDSADDQAEADPDEPQVTGARGSKRAGSVEGVTMGASASSDGLKIIGRKERSKKPLVTKTTGTKTSGTGTTATKVVVREGTGKTAVTRPAKRSAYVLLPAPQGQSTAPATKQPDEVGAAGEPTSSVDSVEDFDDSLEVEEVVEVYRDDLAPGDDERPERDR